MFVQQYVSVYNFNVVWMLGKIHFIVDALSRYPVFTPEVEDWGIAEIDAVYVHFAMDMRWGLFNFMFVCEI